MRAAFKGGAPGARRRVAWPVALGHASRHGATPAEAGAIARGRPTMTLHARTALALTACAAVGALGCGTPDVATAPHAARAAALSQSGAPRHHVTGSGHTPVGMTEDLREFTFHAVEHPDGTVS